MYAFSDDVYLTEIGLASPWKALLSVYKSSYGVIGFQTEEAGAELAKFLLSDAAFSLLEAG